MATNTKNYVVEFDKKGKKETFTIHKKLKQNIDLYLEACLFRDDDVVLLFDGAEGAGKSKLMRQIAKYIQLRMKKWGVEIPFSADNIHFDPKTLMQSAIKNENTKGWINILDEGRRGANRKRSMSNSNVEYTNYLSECRSANHIHLIALPAYHDIDSYVVLWRTKFVIHCDKYFKPDKDSRSGFSLIRGSYRVYSNDKALKNMYFFKIRYTYPRKCLFEGVFENVETLDDVQVYEDKKAEHRRITYGDAINPDGEINEEHTLTKREEKKQIDEYAKNRAKVEEIKFKRVLLRGLVKSLMLNKHFPDHTNKLREILIDAGFDRVPKKRHMNDLINDIKIENGIKGAVK